MLNDKLYLFDFDGTITSKDSFKEFLISAATNKAFFFYNYYFLCIPYLLLYKLGFYNSLKLKIIRLNYIFKNYSILEFKRFSDSFCKKILPSMLKTDALKYLNDIKLTGKSDIFIISGSFDFILAEWCKLNSIQLITNNTEITENHGKIHFSPTNNLDCVYAEKIYRLRELINTQNYNYIESFGDTEGDFYLYAISDNFNHNFFKGG
jgi:HAD superfamily phosphoserine phosphatase-like hydrolase